jgi:UDP-glucose 4-epimerase
LVGGKPPPRSAYAPAWLADLSGLHLAVLGADGFIGSHAVRLALGAGARVRGLCVKEPWRLLDLDSPRLTIEPVPDGRWWECDFREQLAGADVLTMLAYEPPPGENRLEHELSVNTAGAERVAGVAAGAGARVVFASSADVYGPWHEAPVSEDTDPSPATPYAKAKLEAERRLAEKGALSLRIATVFGPGEDGPRAIPSFARALSAGKRPTIHGDGSDLRDYVHVADAAAAILNGAVAGTADPVVNVGSGVGRSTLDVLRLVRSAMDVDVEPVFAPRSRPESRLVLRTERARKLLGFDPRSDFDAALEEEVEWLKPPGEVGTLWGVPGVRPRVVRRSPNRD